MANRYIVLLFGLVGAMLPMGGLHAQQPKVLNVALAGTMEHVISRQMGPAFTATTGYTLNVTRQSSVALANRNGNDSVDQPEPRENLGKIDKSALAIGEPRR
jgi:ABC-type molybdate transport system substrate-binding protein